MAPSPPTGPDQDARRLRWAFWLSAGFVALLWVIKLGELLFGTTEVAHGVYPLRVDGLAGILSAPLFHASVTHLVANTAPLLVLGTALIYGYPTAAPWVLAVVYLGAGLGVWLFARPGYHLGASGLTFGMLTFVFTMGALRWDRRAIALALAVFLLYGGALWGIFPTAPNVSFEYHLCGALLGVALAVLFRHRDPPPPAPRYSWEGEEERDDWPSDPEPRDPLPGGDDPRRLLH